MKGNTRAMTVLVWILQVGASIAFLGAGGAKLAGAAAMVQLFDQIGVGQWFRYVTGSIEVLSSILLLVPAGAVFGAVLLVCTMIGAILTHLLILHTSPAGPVVLLITVSVITWLRRQQIYSVFRGEGRAARREVA
jgi:putative oxidoreductase